MYTRTTFFEILAVIAFLILLIAAIMMVINFYACDHMNCKAFNQASEKATEGTDEYTLALLSETYNDGLWPLPYIGAAILTPLCLWFVNAELTIKNFAVMFLISFLVIYFISSFFGHHYIKPIARYVSSYIAEPGPKLQPQNNNEASPNMSKTAELSPVEDPKNNNTGISLTNKLSETPESAQPTYNENVFRSFNKTHNDPICHQTLESNIPKLFSHKKVFESFNDGLGITFATPVNIFD